jgi:hypothetical protein
VNINGSEKYTVSIFRAEVESACFSETLVDYLLTSLHGVTAQKMDIDIFTRRENLKPHIISC